MATIIFQGEEYYGSFYTQCTVDCIITGGESIKTHEDGVEIELSGKRIDLALYGYFVDAESILAEVNKMLRASSYAERGYVAVKVYDYTHFFADTNSHKKIRVDIKDIARE